MKKYFLIVSFIITLVGMMIVFQPNLGTITTDSGWDSDYSSSDSSWDSGSSWDSSSSWDSNYSSSSSSHSYSSSRSETTLFEAVVLELFVTPFYVFLFYILVDNWKTAVKYAGIRLAVMLLLETIITPELCGMSFSALFPLAIIFSCLNKGSKKQGTKSKKPKVYYTECPEEELNSVGIYDRAKLKDDLYKKFVDVQMAWMNFDYDALSKLCSNELFNTYKSELEVLKAQNGQNIMDSFEINKIYIVSAKKNNDDINIQVYLLVSFHDYVIDTTNNKVTRGNKSTVMNNGYLLEYTKGNTIINNCPSCGAKLEDVKENKCPYCQSTIINNNDEFVLVHKERVQ